MTVSHGVFSALHTVTHCWPLLWSCLQRPGSHSRARCPACLLSSHTTAAVWSGWPQASSFGEVIKPQFGGLMVCNSVWIHLHPTACRHIWYWKGQSFPIWLSSFWGTLLPSRNRHEPHRGPGLWYKHSVWGWVESYCTGADLKNLEQSHWSQPYCYLTYFCLTSEGFKPRDSSL